MAHQEVVNPGRNRKKRARTGCLRCRTRRRKCDEHKPRCQRCIDAEAECVYGPRLSFLQKNAITLSSSNETGPSTKKPDEPPKYSKVQFVDSRLAHQKDINLGEEAQAPVPSPPSIEEENNGIHDSPPRSGLEPITPSTSIEERPNIYLSFEDLHHENSENVTKEPRSQNEALPHNEEYRDQHIGIRQGDSYEIALDVLMTLGTGDPGVDTPTPAPPDSDDIGETSAPSPSPPSILKSIEELGPVSRYVKSQLSLARPIELLRHYRYKIAPWLDICDMRQTFGLVVPHLAMRSDMLFDALMKFCTSSYEASIHHGGSTNSQKTGHSSHLTYPAEYHHEESKIWEVKLWSILTAVEGFLIDPPRSWEDALGKNNFLHMIYAPIPESSPLRVVNERMFWLLVRLGVAVGLFKSATPFISSSLIRSLLRSSTQRGHKSGYIDFRYAHETLVLCTEVLEFSFGDEETVDSLNRGPRAVHWKSIVDELNNWYTSRPHTFRPVLELSAEESSFPIMYFTSGAATFANQLYHVAMMLMLAHKPRTIQLDQRRSSTLSQLWHAQRICGIATNNNRYECWDPCLLASFYLAARRMTHEAQQREVLLGFEHAGALGWRASSFVDLLNQEWHASEPLLSC